MASSYPSSADALSNPASGDALSTGHAAQHANANDAIEAIESTLGLNPQGASATVKARLDAIEADSWVTSARIADGTITGTDIASGTVATANVADGAITPIKTPVFTILLVLEITQALGSFRSVFSTAGTAAWDTGYGASNPITAGILRMFGSYASTYVEISPTLSTWYALMMTYDGANLRVYLNNSEQGSIAVGSPTYATTTKLAIGGAFNTGSSYGYSCGMSFTDMLVYDKCVDTTERNDLHSWVNTNYGI
jgi:preprotein translocase subunit Sec61beta